MLERGFERYDRLCIRAYYTVRRRLVPALRNSHYEYQSFLADALQGNGYRLDLGAGHHFLPPWVATELGALNLENWTSLGVDSDANALRRHESLDWRLGGNIETLPLRDGTFDLVTANMVVEHVKRPSELFAEVYRVLKPGGRFLVHTPNLSGYTTALSRLLPSALVAPLAKLLLKRDPVDVYPTYYRANSRTALLKLADETHLSVETVSFVQSSPQLIRVPPLMLAEMTWIRVLDQQRFAPYRPCIVAVFRKHHGCPPTA